jgi:hypothetical protein
MVKSKVENIMKAGLEDYHWRFESLHCWGNCLVFWVSEQQYESGGRITGEVQSLTFQGENPRSGRNWLCLAMALLKALFWERGLSSRWKPKIIDRATMALVHCFPSWRHRFWRAWSSDVVLVVFVLLLLGLAYRRGSFIFLVYFSLFDCVHLYCS